MKLGEHTYRGEVLRARYHRRCDGSPIVRVTFQLLDSEAGGTEVEWIGCFDTANEVRNTVRSLRLMGFDPMTLDEDGGVGAKVVVELELHNDRFGFLRLVVASIGPQGDSMFGDIPGLNDEGRTALMAAIHSATGGRRGRH